MSIHDQEPSAQEANQALLNTIASGYARILRQLSLLESTLPNLRVAPPVAAQDGQRQEIECHVDGPDGDVPVKITVESAGDAAQLARGIAASLYLLGEHSNDFRIALLDGFRLLALGYGNLPEGAGIMLPEDVQAQAMDLVGEDADSGDIFRAGIDLAASETGIGDLLEAIGRVK